MTSATKALVLDVDGVVSPVFGHTAWGDDIVAGHLFGPVFVSPTMCQPLDRLAAHPGRHSRLAHLLAGERPPPDAPVSRARLAPGGRPDQLRQR